MFLFYFFLINVLIQNSSWLEYLQNRTESSKNDMQELLELVDDTKQLLLDVCIFQFVVYNIFKINNHH